ncbi:Elongation factor 3 [Wickerhamomyces ciferrii]|uniref:Elongation factor 3 n=1 Tax=Wickerhamomyces ciferrii (strain ATCC 14091 / BCRC 22168 / CBS 111 / JCM 3599 / NBRC 0793 / NRRL Y-1031 F-60-10) TaxID=1206466 RepID=K0KIV0_WICCF|nr:Elongation factor 3 [Wickerhamomyces ciferrii]CCH41349.1 Elongation factor 3 [Wickerhamomyces ciferrii]
MPPKFNPQNSGSFIPGGAAFDPNQQFNNQFGGYQAYGQYQGGYQNQRGGYQNGGYGMQRKAMSYDQYVNQAPAGLNRAPRQNPRQQQQFQPQQQDSNPSSYASTPAGSNLNSPSQSTTSLSSLNQTLDKLDLSPISSSLNNLKESKTISDVKVQINSIVDLINENGIESIESWKIDEILSKLIKPKNPALIREGGYLLISSIVRKFAGQTPNESHFLPLLSIALDGLADKENNVKRASQAAIDSIYGSYPVEALSSVVLVEILKYLTSSAKWQSKIGALKIVDKIVEDSPSDLIELKFKEAVPVLTDMSVDFKPELAKIGLKTTNNFVKVLDNLDLQPRFDMIISTLADPNKVPDCIKSLSSVTFVAEVTEPALSLLVPILVRSLNLTSSSQEQLRQTVIVVENLTRLVNNKFEIESFIPLLMPGVQKVVDTAALPEVRELAEKALKVLKDDSIDDGKFSGRLHFDEGKKYLTRDLIPKIDDISYNYLVSLIVADANVNDWKRLEEYLNLSLPQFISNESEVQALSTKLVTDLRTLFTPDAVISNEDDGIEIVNSDFSLAYGGRMLLNKTNLRLLKGHRYGLCGRNGAGKSTLMRAIANGQLEGFPDKSELRTCFVEHKLQGSEADMDLVAFIASDPELEAVSRDEISKALEEVGFDQERREQHVGSLSGGWKMKLELARAMLMKADVLLLDEPTNHLDVGNVKWLQDYLVEHDEITSLIVSHDSGFLDTVCTDIIHYENKKLAYYKGNLSEFVKVKPEGKSYYTLTDSNVKMAFPPPGILTGVKSNTRAVARMADVTFAYPGAAKPSLSDVSCSLSLSSRVAILGPNGAGKSTLIKLLTGELIPNEGKVEKHPNLRIGYIAQHALQHVEQHKEKTANQYLQWRYRFGDDREVLLKESRKVSDEEKALMEKEIDIQDGRGPRQLEAIVGRQKLKKSFQYEVKWKFWLPKYNSWVPKELLIEHGFDKLVQKFDDHEASREGLGYRQLIPSVIREHFEGVGLDGDIADHTPMGSLSGGQLVKVVIAGAMWNNPHLLVLDEPTNYLDRDSLGGLAVAIRDWSGGVVMISHNNEFVGALCPEQWIVENGTMVRKGFNAIDGSSFEDNGGAGASSKEGSPAPTKKAGDDDSPANIKVRIRKKKMTRNDKKLRDERRRLRHIEWLSSPKGTPKPVDTDDEE